MILQSHETKQNTVVVQWQKDKKKKILYQRFVRISPPQKKKKVFLFHFAEFFEHNIDMKTNYKTIHGRK